MKCRGDPCGRPVPAHHTKLDGLVSYARNTLEEVWLLHPLHPLHLLLCSSTRELSRGLSPLWQRSIQYKRASSFCLTHNLPRFFSGLFAQVCCKILPGNF